MIKADYVHALKEENVLDYIVILPEKLDKNSNILVSMIDGTAREFDTNEDTIDITDNRLIYMAENANMPIIIPVIKEWGNVIKPQGLNSENLESDETRNEYKKHLSKYTQLDPEVVNEEPQLFEAYRNTIINAYKRLIDAQVLNDRSESDYKIDLEGYSAQGVKAQRLAMLIPDMIRSVFVGGAISSIPIVDNNEIGLNYPIGFRNIGTIVGTEKNILPSYKQIFQNLYVSEYELEYKGNFEINGKPVSQHDKSPDVAEVVDKQVELFGEDINNRVNEVIRMNLKNGCNIQNYKIYKGTNHHSANTETIDDMFRVIDDLNKGQIIQLPKSADRISTDPTHNCTKTKMISFSINDLQKNAIKQGTTTEDVENCDRIINSKDKEHDIQATIDD